MLRLDGCCDAILNVAMLDQPTHEAWIQSDMRKDVIDNFSFEDKQLGGYFQN